MPPALADEYDTEVKKAEEDPMARIGQFEQRAEQRGALQAMREAVMEAVKVRFPEQAATVDERLQRISDVGTLRELLRKALTAGSAADLESALP
jgi:hypothetical protein